MTGSSRRPPGVVAGALVDTEPGQDAEAAGAEIRVRRTSVAFEPAAPAPKMRRPPFVAATHAAPPANGGELLGPPLIRPEVSRLARPEISPRATARSSAGHPRGPLESRSRGRGARGRACVRVAQAVNGAVELAALNGRRAAPPPTRAVPQRCVRPPPVTWHSPRTTVPLPPACAAEPAASRLTEAADQRKARRGTPRSGDSRGPRRRIRPSGPDPRRQ